MSLLEEVLEGELSLKDVGDEVDPDEAARVRREALEEWTDASLDSVGNTCLGGDEVEGNVENFFGTVQVPLGAAGPLNVDGDEAEGDYYLPLATTEGALVASVNRGCSAIAESGGATARIFDDGMTRAPVFRTRGVEETRDTVDWVRENADAVRDRAESTTEHGELLGVEPHVAGDNLYLRFGYDTKDAMGMNMATRATSAACELVEEETGAELIALSGNVCADKKPAAVNVVEGRGKTVTADVVLDEETVERKLKTTPESVSEVVERKTHVGSARAGTLGANAHAANVVAGVFVATGQDVAQVVEASSTFTTATVREGGLYVSVTLPSLELGTVGGGTSLPTQEECLSVIGVDGGGNPEGSNADELAEVVAGGVLAGEISLHAALASRHLDSAHDELA
ncbi:MAG: hydroxymethylglutaryl-CoA reductase (NADPH) [Halobacteria archaeon]|nr:hydroxymethylglutaryl-CoA reductase (NADPH) [Halobacteria archaeon]